MADSSSLPEPLHTDGNNNKCRSDYDDLLELNKDLEKMIESMEHILVQLTLLTYDTVAVRTSPEMLTAMQKLDEAYSKCRTAVWGDGDGDGEGEVDKDQDLEPEMDKSPQSTASNI